MFADRDPYTYWKFDRALSNVANTSSVRVFVLGDDMEEKRCSKCGVIKTVGEFHKDVSRLDGLQCWCKMCFKAYREANPEKKRAADKAYYERNREKKLAVIKAYREANLEKISACQKTYREDNPEKILARRKAYYEANPEKIRAKVAKRRARKNGAAGQASAEQRAARWDYYSGKCYICGAPAEAIDHVIPLDKGGSNWSANLRPICKRCNSTKGAKWPYDFEQARTEETL